MKIVRIILSPLIFLFLLGGLIIIPLGILSFIMGLISLIGNVLFENKKDLLDNISLMFLIVILPYYITLKFIKGDPTWLD